MTDALSRLEAMQSADVSARGGRMLAHDYESGLPDLDRIGRAAVATYAGANGLDPTAFPSLLRMENDLVGYAASLLDAPESVVGSVTSGGTESILLAVQAARDSRPDVGRSRMVLPETAHAAFHKAAHYFGVKAVSVPVGADFRADPLAMAAAVDEDHFNTVLIVASAPSYAHGVIDPVAEIADGARQRGIRCHVDACLGGWVLPFAARLGHDVVPWTFALDGVTSISVDLHKYAYAPKGTSLLLHRTPEHRRTQFFASAAWPGYTMLNSTIQSTKSGGPLAGAWAVVESLGNEGYLLLTRDVLEAVERIVTGVHAIPALSVVVAPDSTLIALATDDSCDAFTICDEMSVRGWYVQPQMSYAGQPCSIHLTVSAATLASVDEFLIALTESVAAAAAMGPVRVEPGVAARVESLDPGLLADEDFEELLTSAGVVHDGGAIVLPSRMAEVNAVLDLASPALREALMVAFLDRATRPTRR